MIVFCYGGLCWLSLNWEFLDNFKLMLIFKVGIVLNSIDIIINLEIIDWVYKKWFLLVFLVLVILRLLNLLLVE